MFAAFVNLVPTEKGKPGIRLHRPLVICLRTAWRNDAEQADKNYLQVDSPALGTNSR